MLEIILGFIQQLGSQPPWLIAWQLFTGGGWVLFIILFFVVGKIVWMNWRQNLYMSKQKFVLLAIDIPEAHLQTTKAVEQIFAALWGSFGSGNKKEKWWDGRFQLAYSIELVSIEGFVQFLIHTPAPFQDLVESAIYAQYPDCEIVEVEDYTKMVPNEFPSEDWDLWGVEFQLTKSDVYPIKTYPLFEHMLKAQFVDPLASLLEIMARIGPGEQVWLQWVITPISDSWQEKSQKEVKKILGIKAEVKPNFIQKLFAPIIAQLADILKQGSGLGTVEIGGGEDAKTNSKLSDLSPGERSVVEAIQNKASKIGYQTKMRFIYTGYKERMNKARGVSGVVGALRQFSALNLNGFKGNIKTVTGADYFRVEQRVAKRQQKILSAFRSRSQSAGGGNGFILNTEELATLWHFPNEEVKVPQVKRSDTKLVEPPITLPVESSFREINRPPHVVIEEEDEFEQQIPSHQEKTQPEQESQESNLPEETELSDVQNRPKVTIEGRQESDSAQPKSISTPDNLPFG